MDLTWQSCLGKIVIGVRYSNYLAAPARSKSGVGKIRMDCLILVVCSGKIKSCRDDHLRRDQAPECDQKTVVAMCGRVVAFGLSM